MLRGQGLLISTSSDLLARITIAATDVPDAMVAVMAVAMAVATGLVPVTLVVAMAGTVVVMGAVTGLTASDTVRDTASDTALVVTAVVVAATVMGTMERATLAAMEMVATGLAATVTDITVLVTPGSGATAWNIRTGVRSPTTAAMGATVMAR